MLTQFPGWELGPAGPFNHLLSIVLLGKKLA